MDDKELEKLSKELGLEVETETISLEELEKAETAENVKRIVEALENNQKILLQLLNSILQNQKGIVDQLSRLEKPTVPPTTVPYTPPPQIVFPSYKYEWWVKPATHKTTWKTLSWESKTE